MIFVSCPTTTGEEQSAYLIKRNLLTQAYTPEHCEVISKAYFNAMVSLKEKKSFEKFQKYQSVYDTIPFIKNLGWIMTEEEFIQEQEVPKEFYDPGPAISKIECPILVIYGQLDTQVNPKRGIEDFNRYLEPSRNCNYSIELIPGTNHAIWLANDGSLNELVQLLQSGSFSYPQYYLNLMKEWVQR